MPVLVTSDWHLNSKPRDRYRHDWQKELCKLVVKHRVDTVVMLGDLTDDFDRHPASLVNDIIDHLVSLTERAKRVYLMRGNHDYVDDATPFFRFTYAIPGAVWINTPTLEPIDGLGNVLFLPHTRDYEKDWAEVDFNAAHICFAHNTFKGTVSESGQQLDGVPIGVIPERLRVVSGDIHKRQTVGNVDYVGSPYTIDFGDDYEPRVLLFDDPHGRSIPCGGPQKRLIVADLSKDQGLRCLKNVGNDIIKLRVTGIGSQEALNWTGIKRTIVEDAIKQGVRLHSIEAVLDPAVRAPVKNGGKPKARSRTDAEILAVYCRDRAVVADVAATGTAIIEETKSNA